MKVNVDDHLRKFFLLNRYDPRSWEIRRQTIYGWLKSAGVTPDENGEVDISVFKKIKNEHGV